MGLCKTCIHTKVCMKDKNIVGDVYVAPNPWFFDEEYKKKSWEKYLEWKKEGFPCSEYMELVRCKDCRWGREVCGNIECSVDYNLPPEYHGYDWFCPNGERREDADT